MSKAHTHYLAVLVAAKGGQPSLAGPFLTYADATAEVQEQLSGAEAGEVVGGVIPFEVVEPAAAEAEADDGDGDEGSDAGGSEKTE